MNNHTDKKDADLIVGYTNYDPEGQAVYHPAIMKMAIIWAIVLGVILGYVGYMVSSGAWPIRDLGQYATSGTAVSFFVGAVTGIALGGLIGALIGMGKMKHKSRDM
ncbi:hypothetical protein [Pontibacter anaerobius]|uniref:Glycine zipper family protein n=1 Tax=Pontibacter anaerobius TaxID=2993940 RepID=A0ABT3RG87_9BACT|nr:hypothetical protein [Pontibacter anaerobius]MCX2740843.1 hypothetical protein [Pontibacter anaerobius]